MRIFYLFLVALVFGHVSQVSAETVYSGNVHATLLSQKSSISPGDSFWVGLQMSMDQNWHTYWKNAGDSGFSTQIQWKLPQGFEASDLYWPYPKRIDYYEGVTSYGHEGNMILLTEIKSSEDIKVDQQFTIEANAGWLSCEKICVPGKAQLSIDLTVQNNEQINIETDQLFRQEMRRWPLLKSTWQIKAIDQSDAIVFNISPKADNSLELKDLEFFPYNNDVIKHWGRQILNKSEDGFELQIPKSNLLENPIEYLNGVLVTTSGWNGEGRRLSLLVDVAIGK